MIKELRAGGWAGLSLHQLAFRLSGVLNEVLALS